MAAAITIKVQVWSSLEHARCWLLAARSSLLCKRDASPRVTLYLIELSLAFQAILLLYIILYVCRHQSSPLAVYIIQRVAEQAHNILTRRQNRKLKHAFWLFQPAPPCLCCVYTVYFAYKTKFCLVIYGYIEISQLL